MNAGAARLQPGRKPVIGLSGGIGAGKSHIARLLEQLGCAVIDADALARSALEDPQVRARVMALLGSDVADADGTLNRRRIAERVFGHADRLAELEAIIHPWVHARRYDLRRRYQRDSQAVAIVEDCPLLFEKGLDAEVDRTIFVDAPRPVRLARLTAERGWTEADLDQRERNQWELDSKARRADYVVVNDTSGSDLLPHVRRVLFQIIHDLQ